MHGLQHLQATVSAADRDARRVGLAVRTSMSAGQVLVIAAVRDVVAEGRMLVGNCRIASVSYPSSPNPNQTVAKRPDLLFE